MRGAAEKRQRYPLSAPEEIMKRKMTTTTWYLGWLAGAGVTEINHHWLDGHSFEAVSGWFGLGAVTIGLGWYIWLMAKGEA
jgi:hypothetical protein